MVKKVVFWLVLVLVLVVTVTVSLRGCNEIKERVRDIFAYGGIKEIGMVELTSNKEIQIDYDSTNEKEYYTEFIGVNDIVGYKDLGKYTMYSKTYYKNKVELEYRNKLGGIKVIELRGNRDTGVTGLRIVKDYKPIMDI